MAATAFEQVAYDLVPKSRLGSLFKDETGGGGGEGRNRFRLSPPLPLFFPRTLGRGQVLGCCHITKQIQKRH